MKNKNVSAIHENHSGMSLIEMAVVLGIGAFLSLAGAGLISGSIQVQKRSEAISSKDDLRNLIYNSTIGNFTVGEEASCTNYVKLNSASFDKVAAATESGVPMQIVGLPSFQGLTAPYSTEIKAGALTPYGYISELSFANARLATATTTNNSYLGVLYINVLKNATDKSPSARLPIGSLILNIDNGTSALAGCVAPKGSISKNPCTVLGQNLIYDANSGNCVGVFINRITPACAAGERAYTDTYGRVGCMPVVKSMFCGQGLVANGAYQGALNCDPQGVTNPDYGGGIMPAGHWYNTCGVGENLYTYFLRCIEGGVLAECEAQTGISYAGNEVGSLFAGCQPPTVIDGTTSAPTMAPLVSATAPGPGQCACGSTNISDGEKCTTCWRGSDMELMGSSTATGYRRRAFLCENGKYKYVGAGCPAGASFCFNGDSSTVSDVACLPSER
jgi:type II secretory pathway pseudopilin PulG